MRAWVWAILSCAVLLSGAARAAELTMVSIAAPPWASYDSAGRPVGAFVDIVGELERRTGTPITVGLYTLARVERELESGAADCTIILWADARGHLVERGEAVYPMTFGVIARRGLRLRDYDDLRRLTISVVRTLRIDPQFDADATLLKDFDKDYAAGLSKLERSHVDAIAGALPTIAAHAAASGLAEMLGERLVFSLIPLTLQCARRSPRLALMAALDQAIHDMRADGSLARLLARHGYH